jgi:hypothetical protein
MKNIFALTILSSVLAGCGGLDSDSDSDVVDNVTLLSDLFYVWDASETDGQLVDEKYVVVKANNVSITYDFAGDSFDQGVNCYTPESSTITDLGNGIFEDDDGSGLITTSRVVVTNNALAGTILTINSIDATEFFADNNIEGDLAYSWAKSSRLESDFLNVFALNTLAISIKTKGFPY